MLEWRQVDFDAGEIRLDAGTTKNDEGRIFPMTIDLRKMLKAQHDVGGRLKTGHSPTPQNRPFPALRSRPVEFYFGACSVRKSVWTLVRQLRGPHLSTCA